VDCRFAGRIALLASVCVDRSPLVWRRPIVDERMVA
jgi:hypothetical protein